MSDVDFNAILDTQVDEIKSKPPLPVGSYNFRIKSLENVTSSQKKTPGVEFTVVPYEAGAEVDSELLEEAGLDREMRLTFWITPDSAAVIKDFLTVDCGIEGSGRTLRQILAEATGQCFKGIVTHGMSKKDRPFAQIDKTMKIE